MQEQTISITYLRQHLSEVLASLENSQGYVLTYRGRSIAYLKPVENTNQLTCAEN
jgi:antitoxin (DNA-binding transcriptional repressor) of toxin-antitoxin stability system